MIGDREYDSFLVVMKSLLGYLPGYLSKRRGCVEGDSTGNIKTRGFPSSSQDGFGFL